MINIELEIFIRSDKTVVWAFMSDITKALSLNRYHHQVSAESYRTIKGLKFQIEHKIFYTNTIMNATITHCQPPDILCITEEPSLNSKKGFCHKCTYQLKSEGYGTKLIYKLDGSYNNVLLDLPFKPILRVTMIEELLRIKHTIESSQPNLKMNGQNLHPV
ncbi:MAG: hypothetical protein HN729_06440 [Candidatus Marinimicrobia bacterium]|jgi:hypothetical protein|nr:hypothetical protein [Candidatus Neomarinimicrobiota bacterium]MBT3683714.1 hypothetical protein [Candidatus Neomarinimicrobiota bacterium]MBT3760713.1 hypothetical protein [Candidatus Neomarinimicrobiota bacterium]MBT3896729.1 hypothetical protein [Candidatus Neomarinimicrobiota bacterium]MBT4173787.1 hypothetical protein [Candidatus Neomarinimicrobiota bacterium]